MKKNQIFGGVLLVAGCCIGAGMLGLPTVTGPAGFVPSVCMFALAWLFMINTGMLLLEVNLAIGAGSGIISMAQQTLGKTARAAAWMLFVFLFYCLIVAYVSGTGQVIAQGLSSLVNIPLSLPAGCFLSSIAIGFLVYLGTTVVDRCNRILMLCKGVSYLLLVALGAPFVQKTLLLYQNWSLTLLSWPILIVSFGFHNMVPSLTQYFHGHARALKWTLLLGSLLPLLIYISWEILVLGIAPVQGPEGILAAYAKGETGAQILQKVLGQSKIASIANYFAFFSLSTSFLAVVLSFVHFLTDGFHLSSSAKNRGVIVALVLLPATLFGASHPALFLTALNYAGGIGAVLLFGVLPPLMVWAKRYRLKIATPRLVPGGKPLLCSTIGVALFILLLQIAQTWGLKLA